MHNPPRPHMNTVPPANGGAPEELSTRERIARVKTLAGRAGGHWKMAFLLFLIGCGIAVGTAWNQKMSYRSECIVRFQAKLKMGERDEESTAERASKLAPKLKEQLTTRARLETVIKEFKLYPKIVESQGMLAAVEEMREKHVGFRGKDSESYVISFEDGSPEIAQKVTQRLADTMIDEYTRGNLDQVLKQVQFLKVEESRSETELVMANRSFASFLQSNPEFRAELANPGSTIPGSTKAPGMFVPNKVSSGDPQLDALQAQKWRLETQIKAIQNGTPLASPTTGTPQQEARLSKAKRDREEAQKAVDEANTRVSSVRATGASDANPDMVSAKRMVDVSRASLAAADNSVREAEMDIRLRANPFDSPAAGGNVEVQRKKLADVEAQIASYRARRSPQQANTPAVDAGPVMEPVSDVVRLAADFQKLSRALTEKKSEHDDLREKLKKAEFDAAGLQSNTGDKMSILDPAYRPMRPSKGGKSKTAMAGAAVALFVALLYAFARVIFNDTMIDAADIEGLKLIPVLGVLPRIPPQPTAHPNPSPAMAKGGPPGAV